VRDINSNPDFYISPELTLSADPTEVQQGESTTITWNVFDADICTKTGDWSGTANHNDGLYSEEILNITSNSTFGLECGNVYGNTYEEVNVIITNTPPNLSSIPSQLILEDEATSLISFSISDSESDASELILGASSSNFSVVHPNDIQFYGTDENRSIQISSIPDQNTSLTEPVVITVVAYDEGGLTAETSFTISVDPVNDPPTFTLPFIPEWPAGSSGSRVHNDLFKNITMGPTSDESNQYIISSSTNVLDDSNSIFVPGGEPEFSLGGDLWYVLSGNGGFAIVSVSLQDSGGTNNGGTDISEEVFFEISVLEELLLIDSFTVNGQSNGAVVNLGDSVHVAWNTSGANDCIASANPSTGGWSGVIPVNGTATVVINQLPMTLHISCSNNNATVNSSFAITGN
jgi:hypothetical protein